MRLTSLCAFAFGAAAMYCLTARTTASAANAEPASTDPRDFANHATTKGSQVPAGGDPDLVGT